MPTDNLRSPIHVNFLLSWFITLIVTLFFAIIFSFYIGQSKILRYSKDQFGLYAALPGNSLNITEEIEKKDARSKIIDNLFTSHNSPLVGLGTHFVKVSDKYNLDFRLLPAISMQESNGGKKIIDNSYNPFGYGIYGSLVIRFASWEEAIERVGKALREDYLDKGLSTPQEIMGKYTPPSLEKGGAWAEGVSYFMDQLK